MTQVEKIAEILRRDGQIDNFYALRNRITLRLAARIKQLRDKGWNIITEERPDKNTVYRLAALPLQRKQVTEYLPNGTVRVSYREERPALPVSREVEA